MSEWITPGKTIGIIGGGQIARLMTITARKMGYEVAVLDPREECPAAELADWQVRAEYTDEKAVMDFAFKCDVILYETEEADADLIDQAQRTVAVPQGEQLLSIAQDRTLQKAYLESLSINIAPFATIVSKEDIKEAIVSIGFPCVLKPNQTDDKTVDHLVLQGEEDIEKSGELLKRGTCVLEAWIPSERELCVVAAKDTNEKIVQLSLAETIYRRGTLYQSITPPRIEKEVAQEVSRIMMTFAENTHFQGVFSIELFATSTGALYVNEIIPSPHLSANHTMETSNLSQFDAHIRAVCGWPLPDARMFSSSVTVPFHLKHEEKVNKQIQLKPDWHFYYYSLVQSNEASGHITIMTDDIAKTLETLSDINLWSER